MYKVLIVEDDPMVAMINEQYVSRNRAFVTTGKCNDGESALEYLEKKSADLVILDVFLPRLSGLEVLRRIREKNINTAVIMVTAANDPATFQTAMSLGAVDYLVKPFSYERFRAALERFTARAAALKNGGKLDQNSIDMFMGRVEAPKDELPKGIQEQTLSVMIRCLEENGDWMTGEEIGAAIGISTVTVRRYTNYLVQTGKVQSKINYDTGGRPARLYKIGQ